MPDFYLVLSEVWPETFAVTFFRSASKGTLATQPVAELKAKCAVIDCGGTKMRREPLKYTVNDYRVAKASLESARTNYALREKSAVWYRSEIAAAEAFLETIRKSLKKQRLGIPELGLDNRL